MEIIGNGFLAGHLRPFEDRHPDTVVLAAGVSRPTNPEAAYEREVALLEETIKECLRRDRTLTFFSTTLGLYGRPGCRGREDEPVLPVTRYGEHKLALETRVQESGVRHLILRLAHVVGPRNPSHRFVPTLIRQIRSGRVTIFRGAVRDLLDTKDFTAIVDGLLTRRVAQEVVNVASGRSVPVEKIVAHLQHYIGKTAETDFVDGGSTHPLSAAKLQSLLPCHADMGFGAEYYRRVLDRYCEQAGVPRGTR